MLDGSSLEELFKKIKPELLVTLFAYDAIKTLMKLDTRLDHLGDKLRSIETFLASKNTPPATASNQVVMPPAPPAPVSVPTASNGTPSSGVSSSSSSASSTGDAAPKVPRANLNERIAALPMGREKVIAQVLLSTRDQLEQEHKILKKEIPNDFLLALAHTPPATRKELADRIEALGKGPARSKLHRVEEDLFKSIIEAIAVADEQESFTPEMSNNTPDELADKLEKPVAPEKK